LPDIQREVLNTNEVAELLRVSKRTLLREVEEGKLEAFRVGKSLRFTREAIQEYIKRQTIQPGDKLEDEADDAA
jgi:excisionase family DNA binding protein